MIQNKTRVLWLWSRLTGYMAAGWRRLAEVPEVSLKVVAFSGSDNRETDFSDQLLEGVENKVLANTQRHDKSLLEDEIEKFKPDVLVVPGWFHRPYRDLSRIANSNGCRIIMGMDTPFQSNLKSRLTRIRYSKFLRLVERVVVPGSRGAQNAKQLGFREPQITKGLYPYDEGIFFPVDHSNSSLDDAAPKRKRSGFLFVGRYVESKGLKILLRAYQQYRRTCPNPWPLTCIGKGPLSNLVRSSEGVSDLGFIAPQQLGDIFRSHGALVLPSNYEPWGVVVAEAIACGLLPIVSSSVGAGEDLINNGENGFVFPKGDIEQCYQTLLDATTKELPTTRFAKHECSPSTQEWVDNWVRHFS